MDRRRGWELLGVTTAALFASLVARLVLGPLGPEILDEFAISKTALGIALTGMWAAYALFQFPGGIVTDRLGPRRVVLVATGATGLASLVLAAAPTFLLFAVFAMAVGAAAGLYFTAGTAFLTTQFENTGRALGVHEIGASSAGLVAPVVAAVVATRFGWRAGPLFAAGVALAVLVLFAWRTPRTPPAGSPRSLAEQVDVSSLLALLLRPGVLLTTLLAMGCLFTYQSFASFFPTFLVEYAGLSTAGASLVFGGVFALTIVGAPTLGRVSDATGRDAALAATFVASTAGFATFLVADGTTAILAGAVLLGAGLSFPGVLNSRFMDNLAPDERGTGFGLVRTVVLLGSSLGSVATGALADRVGWLAAYGLVAGLMAFLVVLLVGNRVLGWDG